MNSNYMKASETIFRNLIEGSKQFQVPLFQRPYCWEKSKLEALWDDIMNIYDGQVEGVYFLGSIVTQPILGTAEGISPYLIIDGQQRLTTLSILLASLRNKVNKEYSELADELHESYLINKFKKDEALYKVLPTQHDRDFYIKIIQDRNIEIDKDDAKTVKIYEAYTFFKLKLEKNKNLDFSKFKNVILEKLMLVNITSDNDDNPYLIFESLNMKGQELTQADLVRNYMFMKLPKEKQESLYNEIWMPLEENFKRNVEQNKKYSDELTNAFWYYLRKDGESINQKSVYQCLKKKIDKSNIDIVNELKDLTRFVKYYQCFNFPDQEEKNTTLKKYFKNFLRLDFKTSHIFLLNIYDKYESQELSLDDFEKILISLESYFVRRLFTGVSTRVLGTVFNNLYKESMKFESNSIVENFLKILRGYDKKKKWPEDEEFIQGIITKPIYTKNYSDRVKFILERLEQSLTKEKVDFQNLTNEHIMPQTLTNEWRSGLENNYEQIHKKWLHTLGNITLTAYNSELSNKSYSEKLEYIKKSNLSLNQYFRDKNNSVNLWNADTIKNRAEYLAKIAIKVWPR
ncbi:MAG: DUF262 domain-containing protein [Moorea sp. SIO2B7]|nr:DUF262 domain-containing protein [Moorena sp. SIO2B7]